MGNAKPPITFQLLGTSVLLGAGTVKEVGQTFQAAGGKESPDRNRLRGGEGRAPAADQEIPGGSKDPLRNFRPRRGQSFRSDGYGGGPVIQENRVRCNPRSRRGSPLDASKAIQVMTSHPGEIDEYFGTAAASKITLPKPYLIGIPTTSGTGSEVSRGAVITNTKTNTKSVIRTGPSSLAILDPEMTLTLPPKLTAATGMDALSHHIEACVSNVYQPVCTALALEGIRLVGRSLKKAVEKGDDLDARTDMAVASMMGALAFQKGLGAVHSLAHQLSTEADVHHGVANSVMLPHVMRFNIPHVREELVQVARALGEKVDSLTAAQAAEQACVGVARFLRPLGCLPACGMWE